MSMTRTKSQPAAAEAERIVADADGLLRLDPAWVARDFLPPGRRLGLPDDEYELGERGAICERWLASETQADNVVGPPDEGLSYLSRDHAEQVTLADLVQAAPEAVLGTEYARKHRDLGRLAKIFDYGARLPFHIHPRAEDAALVGRNSKEEAYYFPANVPLGDHPEAFFGLHPSIDADRALELLVPLLQAWDSDDILRYSRGFVQVPGEGFHIPAGILHAPGTALAIELQEPSDCMAMFQALNAGKIISKELLYKDIRDTDRERDGEKFLLSWIDWAANQDPWFWENRRLTPQPTALDQQAGVAEDWVFYNSSRFSGKRLRLAPGAVHVAVEPGAYSLFVWSGSGSVGEHSVEGHVPGSDELLVTADRAARPLEFRNTGPDTLEILMFFGPDIFGDEVPMIQPR